MSSGSYAHSARKQSVHSFLHTLQCTVTSFIRPLRYIPVAVIWIMTCIDYAFPQPSFTRTVPSIPFVSHVVYFTLLFSWIPWLSLDIPD